MLLETNCQVADIDFNVVIVLFSFRRQHRLRIFQVSVKIDSLFCGVYDEEAAFWPRKERSRMIPTFCAPWSRNGQGTLWERTDHPYLEIRPRGGSDLSDDLNVRTTITGEAGELTPLGPNSRDFFPKRESLQFPNMQHCCSRPGFMILKLA